MILGLPSANGSRLTIVSVIRARCELAVMSVSSFCTAFARKKSLVPHFGVLRVRPPALASIVN